MLYFHLPSGNITSQGFPGTSGQPFWYISLKAMKYLYNIFYFPMEEIIQPHKNLTTVEVVLLYKNLNSSEIFHVLWKQDWFIDSHNVKNKLHVHNYIFWWTDQDARNHSPIFFPTFTFLVLCITWVLREQLINQYSTCPHDVTPPVWTDTLDYSPWTLSNSTM